MRSSIPFFMIESKPVEKIKTIRKISKFEEKKLERKEIFLMTFVRELGKSSMKINKHSIKVPIKSIIREPIPHRDLSFSKKLVPMKKKSYDNRIIKSLKQSSPLLKIEQKLPKLSGKKHELPILPKKHLEKVSDKKRINEQDGKTFFKPLEHTKLKKYGIFNSLIADERVKKINCLKLEIFVDIGSNKNIPTGLKFKDIKEMNKLIKKFSKITKQKISEDSPILNTEIEEGFKINANLGTNYIPGNLTLVRINSNRP